MDDLRQEQFALQLIFQFHSIFQEAGLPLYLCPYLVIATGPDCGFIEAVPDTVSIDSLKKNHPSIGGDLCRFFMHRFGAPGSKNYRRAQMNFVESMAAYAIVCYLLQVKDRHNGNILLDAEGHIVHIDFGFMLASSPGKNAGFENAPFKLTEEFIQLMGGPRSAPFRRFRSLCVRAFLVARRQRHQIMLLAEMMANGNEELDCFAGDTQKAISELAARFKVRHLFEMFPRGWLPTPLPCRSLISLPVNAKILSMV
jgi:phosphatidylinositol 4-kinase